MLTGKAPVVHMRGYQTEVIAYTRGRGRLFCTLSGYEPCHNAEEVRAAVGYDPEGDLENPTGSVFCAHGAGFTVPWDKVPEYMHVESGWKSEKEPEKAISGQQPSNAAVSSQGWAEEKELEEIFVRTYGPVGGNAADFPEPLIRAVGKKVRG